MSPLDEIIKHSVGRILEYRKEMTFDDETFKRGVNFGLFVALSMIRNDIDAYGKKNMLNKTGLDFDVDALLFLEKAKKEAEDVKFEKSTSLFDGKGEED